MMTKWDDFSFPIPPGLRQDADEIADTIRKQVIRDVYTCMRAKCGDEKISSNDFITVAKKVCKRIPQLKDKKGVGLKVDSGDFAYWVSAIIATSSYCFIIKNYLVIVKVIFFMSKFCPKGKGTVRLTLCEVPTCENRRDHNTGKFYATGS